MYKKMGSALILLAVFSPLVAAVFAGYPLAAAAHPDGSRRCFKTGEWGQFIGCFQTGHILETGRLLKLVASDVRSFSNLFPVLLGGALLTACIAAGLAAFQGEAVEKKQFQHPVDKKE